MKGSIRKRGNSYQYRFHIIDETGKRKEISKGGFKTGKEAEKALRQAMVTIDNQGFNEPSKQTLGEYMYEWLDLYASKKVKDTTFKNYKRVIDSRIVPFLGNVKLNDLKATHGEKFVKYLIDEGLKPRYIEYVFVVLKGALLQAVKWERLYKNPLQYVEIPRPRRADHKTWSMEEIERFKTFSRFNSPIYHITFLLSIHTGMRKGEVLGLRWKDINLEDKKISIVQSLVYDEDGFRFTDLKNASSKRLISIDDELTNELKRYKAKQNEFKLALGNGYNDLDLVCCREDGQPIYPRTLAIKFDEIIKKADVPKIRIHDLRHTHATISLKLGISAKVVQERLGHSSIKTTLDTYSHVTPDMQEEAANIFGQALKNVKKG